MISLNEFEIGAGGPPKNKPAKIFFFFLRPELLDENTWTYKFIDKCGKTIFTATGFHTVSEALRDAARQADGIEKGVIII